MSASWRGRHRRRRRLAAALLLRRRGTPTHAAPEDRAGLTHRPPLGGACPQAT